MKKKIIFFIFPSQCLDIMNLEKKGEVYMKKILAVGALVLTIGAGSLMAYADSPIVIPNNNNQKTSVENRDDWFKKRNEFRKDEIKRALKNGEITEVEAKEWEDHFEYMEEFHNKNRLNNNSFMGGSYGGCGGNSFGMGKGMMGGSGYGMGRGMGMMRSNSLRNY